MSEVEIALSRAVERAYEVFASEPQPQTLHASPHRDAEELLRTLTAAPLRMLTAEQLGPYSGWAMTTVGDERAYRHFLPRIFELSVADRVWVGTEPTVRTKSCTWHDGATGLRISRQRCGTSFMPPSLRP